MAMSQPTVEAEITKLLSRKATTSLLRQLHGTPITAQEVFEQLFCNTATWDTICFRSPECQHEDSSTKNDSYITRNELYFSIYSYIVKRATAISLIEQEGMKFSENWTSATDECFLMIARSFVRPLDPQATLCDGFCNPLDDDIHEIRTIEGHGRTFIPCSKRDKTWESSGQLVTSIPKTSLSETFHQALKIVTEQPLKFVTAVTTYRRTHRAGETRPTEYVIVFVRDTDPKGNFEMEHMSSHRASSLYPDWTYRPWI